jgi:hypothetical protein
MIGGLTAPLYAGSRERFSSVLLGVRCGESFPDVGAFPSESQQATGPARVKLTGKAVSVVMGHLPHPETMKMGRGSAMLGADALPPQGRVP